MMLKTSSRKLNPFSQMIGFTLRKSFGIIVVLCIAALLYCPGSFLVNEDYLLRSQASYREYIIENFAFNVTVIAAIISVFFNMLNFSFLYKKSSSDVFHAFPLTRWELLLSRLLAGLICTLIPVFVCYISFGVLSEIFPWIGSLTQLAYYLLHTVIIVLVCSTFSLIFVISAGSMFDLGLSLIGANVALLVVGSIFDSVLQETLLGYDNYSASDIMYNLSPPYFCGIGLGRADSVAENGISTQSIEFLVRSVIYIIAFTVISILLYNKRKAEKGGTAYAYKFMYLICSVLAGICGGYLLGYLFAYDIASPVFFVFMTVGAILTSVVYGVVTNRGFKKIGHAVLMGGISAAIIISVAISGITGGFGFTNRIPEKQDIKSTYIQAFDEYIYFSDPQDVLTLHKKIVETGAARETTPSSTTMRISFDYNLKNGKTMTREFWVDTSFVEKELLSIYKSDERLNMIKEEVNIEKASQISLYFYQNDEYIQADITAAEAKEFLDAYWLDVQNCGSEILENTYYDYELSGYSKSEDYYFNFMLEAGYNTFVNTKQFVTEHNLVERAKSQQETYEKY